MSSPLKRPIRVVQFSGAYLDAPALRFALMLDEHPDVELVGILAQAHASGLNHRLAELWRRRGVLALIVIVRDLASAAIRFVRAPRMFLAERARTARLASKIVTVPDMHAVETLARLRDWKPDLGAIYGAPVLRPALFEIPALGTFGIHHGRVPDYRGKKTTFWEIYNGERVAGVTIQRINAGIDTGDIVKSGEVPIEEKGYSRVERETQELGYRLFLAAILEARAGCTRLERQPPSRGRHYRQPSFADFLRLWLRRWLQR